MTKRTRNPADFGRVGVLMGGWSSEREVSLWSGKNVVAALERQKVNVAGLDCDRQTILGLGVHGFDRVLNLLHGTGGEDGTVQAALDLIGLPYPGCGVLASALALDKLLTKRIWRAEGVPTPDYMVLESEDDAAEAARQFGFPLIVKPSADGSSVGVSKVKHSGQLAQAFAEARAGNRAVMGERFIAGAEYTCAVLDGEALPLIRIEPDGEFYDYHAKYISEKTRYLCPADLDPAHELRIRAICLRAFELIGGRGWGRVDFMLDGDGEPWLLEVNTIPGMTSHSLVPMAARAVGISFDALCWALLETTL